LLYLVSIVVKWDSVGDTIEENSAVFPSNPDALLVISNGI